jgi:hypothetical protein
MMGNEASHLSGLEIDEKVIEVTDGWTLHSGTVCAGSNSKVSVFISEALGNGGSTVILEKAAKVRMISQQDHCKLSMNCVVL